MKKLSPKNLILIIFGILLLIIGVVLFFSVSRMRSGNLKYLNEDELMVRGAELNSRGFDYADPRELDEYYRSVFSLMMTKAGNDPSLIEELFNDDSTPLISVLYKDKYDEEAADFLSFAADEKKVEGIISFTPDDTLSSSDILPLISEDENITHLVCFLASSYKDSETENRPSFSMKLSDLLSFYENEFDYLKTVPGFTSDTSLENAEFLLGLSALDLYIERDSAELASLLLLDEAKTAQYLDMLLPDIKPDYDADAVSMSLSDLAAFLSENVINNKEYADLISYSMRLELEQFIALANKETLGRMLTASELSSLLGVDETSVRAVLLLMKGSASSKCTVSEFTDYLLDEGVDSFVLKRYLDDSTISKLKLLQSINILTLSDRRLSYSEVSRLFGIDIETLKSVYSYKAELDSDAPAFLPKMMSIYDLLSGLASPVAAINDSSFTRSERDYCKALLNYISLSISNDELTGSEASDAVSFLLPELNKERCEALTILAMSKAYSPDKYIDVDELSAGLSAALKANREIKNLLPEEAEEAVEKLGDAVNAVSRMFIHRDYSRAFIVLDTDSQKAASEAKHLLKKLSGSDGKVYLIGQSVTDSLLRSKYLLRIIVLSALVIILLFVTVQIAITGETGFYR